MRESTKRYIGFNDTWFAIIGVLIIGSLMPFVFFGHKPSDPLPELAVNWIISFTMSIAYWIGCRAIIIYWRKRLTQASQIIRRNALQLVTILVYSFGIEWLIKFLIASLVSAPNDPHPISGTAGTYLVILLIVSIYEATFLYEQWKRALVEQERVKQEHLRSQLEGLRNQVNPHFLFNSLNTLMSIVSEDQDLAIRYLQKLSSVFRHVLENRNEQLIPLDEELSFMENYLFLQKERFRDNLQVELDIPSDIRSHAIVPLSLQILFENAIKHNIISEKKPLRIKTFLNKDNKLEVQNNLQLKDQKSKSTRVGLENIHNRYRFFTEESVDIEVTEDTFSVAIPLLPISKMKSNGVSHH